MSDKVCTTWPDSRSSIKKTGERYKDSVFTCNCQCFKAKCAILWLRYEPAIYNLMSYSWNGLLLLSGDRPVPATWQNRICCSLTWQTKAEQVHLWCKWDCCVNMCRPVNRLRYKYTRWSSSSLFKHSAGGRVGGRVLFTAALCQNWIQNKPAHHPPTSPAYLMLPPENTYLTWVYDSVGGSLMKCSDVTNLKGQMWNLLTI